jgi:broad specificity phosphatase PhoE
MGTVTFVRHGQASFGAEDYDQLSALGVRQCEALGEYLAARGRRFDAVLTGTLKRHAQSLDGIGSRLAGLPAAGSVEALNEYDAEGILRAMAGGRLPERDPTGDRREHFRLLREGLERWMRGDLSVPGMPDWARFRDGVAAVLDELRRSPAAHVLVVSSGGPIATAVAHVLQAPATAVVALNLQMRNSALTEFNFTPARHWLVSYNTLPHLDHPERAAWVSHS